MRDASRQALLLARHVLALVIVPGVPVQLAQRAQAQPRVDERRTLGPDRQRGVQGVVNHAKSREQVHAPTLVLGGASRQRFRARRAAAAARRGFSHPHLHVPVLRVRPKLSAHDDPDDRPNVSQPLDVPFARVRAIHLQRQRPARVERAPRRDPVPEIPTPRPRLQPARRLRPRPIAIDRPRRPVQFDLASRAPLQERVVRRPQRRRRRPVRARPRLHSHRVPPRERVRRLADHVRDVRLFFARAGASSDARARPGVDRAARRG